MYLCVNQAMNSMIQKVLINSNMKSKIFIAKGIE